MRRGIILGNKTKKSKKEMNRMNRTDNNSAHRQELVRPASPSHEKKSLRQEGYTKQRLTVKRQEVISADFDKKRDIYHERNCTTDGIEGIQGDS